MNEKNKIQPLAWLLGLWLAFFSLACQIAAAGIGGETDSGTALLRLLGASRAALGEQLYLKADNVFHKGVGPARPAAFSGWFDHLRAAVSSHGHRHAEGDELRNVLPWLFFATRLDPANITAYAVGAFWLDRQIDRPDLAIQLLREARAQNPRDYRLCMEMGRVWLRGGDHVAAERAFQAGLRLWPYPLAADEFDARVDAAHMRMFLGLLAEERNDQAGALAMYNEILLQFPDRAGVRARRNALRHGRTPEPAPTAIFNNMLAHHDHVCDHEHHE